MREPPNQVLDRDHRRFVEYDRRAADERARFRRDMLLITICFAFFNSWMTAAILLIAVLLAQR